jgi:hypothetical protein
MPDNVKSSQRKAPKLTAGSKSIPDGCKRKMPQLQSHSIGIRIQRGRIEARCNDKNTVLEQSKLMQE